MDREGFSPPPSTLGKTPHPGIVRFYDYDFNIIEIGERMEHVAYRLYQEGKSINDIGKITYLHEDIVKKSIEEYS